MLNPTSLLADALGRNLAETYRRIYGDQEPRIPAALDEAARLVIERIGSSDALYHDCQHTALVTLCVQDNGRGITEDEIGNPRSLGFLGMKERAALLGGEIVFQRGPCGGTIVTARIPPSRSNSETKEQL